MSLHAYDGPMERFEQVAGIWRHTDAWIADRTATLHALPTRGQVAPVRHAATSMAQPTVPAVVRVQAGALIRSVLVDHGLATSSSDAVRLLRAGAVRLNEQPVTDGAHAVFPEGHWRVRAGKHRLLDVHVQPTETEPRP